MPIEDTNHLVEVVAMEHLRLVIIIMKFTFEEQT